MSGFHSRMRDLTTRRLGIGGGGLGSPLVLHKVSEGVYNPKTSKIEGAKNDDYNGSGLRVNYTSFEYRDVAIQRNDYKLYVCPVLVNGNDCPAPVIGDTITFDNDLYKVINLEAWNASGLDCGWKCQMRKA